MQEIKSSQPKAEASSSQDDNKNDDEEEKNEDKKISFYLKLGKFKTFKYIQFLFLFLESKMNHLNANRINNFLYMYSIKNTEENFKKLREVIEERYFIIYCKILYMINNCRIIEEDSTGITVEIDMLVHRKLLENLTNNFFTKKISTRKVEKKKKKLDMLILWGIHSWQ